MKFPNVSDLSDSDLLHATELLVRSERRTAAEVVVHLAEIDARQLHLARGFSCLRDYCMQVLGLSEYEAFARIEAARAGRRFFRVFEMLLEGSLSLTRAPLVGAPAVTRSGPSGGSLPVVSGAIRAAAAGAPCPPAT